MYDVALAVGACVRAGTRVVVAWPVTGAAPDAAVALTPGGGRVGRLLNGALDQQLEDVAGVLTAGRLVAVTPTDPEAAAAGLARAETTRLLVVPADRLPADLWRRLADREPVCLVCDLDDASVTRAALVEPEQILAGDEETAALWRQGRSAALVREDRVTTVLHPVPTLVVGGPGPVADALADLAPRLGWRVVRESDAAAAADHCLGLSPLDKVVVTGHDDQSATDLLAAALSGRAGYVAVVAAEARVAARRQVLADRGVTGLERIHGPAGLPIGARDPAEVAVAVLAEAIASRPPGQGIA